MTSINIGIEEAARHEITGGLKRLLADSYPLYLQTHNFKLNVTGPQFREPHLMLEEHCTELATADDEIAERIRTLGVAAPGTYRVFTEYSAVVKIEGVPTASERVSILNKGHEQVARTSRRVQAITRDAKAESTAALVSDRMRVLEKTAWMLRAVGQMCCATH